MTEESKSEPAQKKKLIGNHVLYYPESGYSNGGKLYPFSNDPKKFLYEFENHAQGSPVYMPVFAQPVNSFDSSILVFSNWFKVNFQLEPLSEIAFARYVSAEKAAEAIDMLANKKTSLTQIFDPKNKDLNYDGSSGKVIYLADVADKALRVSHQIIKRVKTIELKKSEA